MVITGMHFQDGAAVSFELADGTRFTLDPSYVTFIDSTEIQIIIPGGFLPSQGLFPVWVTNPDTREDVYYSYNATSSAEGTYTVKAGDTLWKIAQDNGISDWHSIYNLNADQIENPDLIYVGQHFVLS